MFNSPFFASLPDDEPLIQSRTLTKRITAIQKQVEGRHFDMRKHVLEYDDVMNQHRLIIYGRRQKILEDFEKQDVRNSDIDLQVDTILKNESERTTMKFEKEGTIERDELQEEVSSILGEPWATTSNRKEEIQEEILIVFRRKLASIRALFQERNFDHFQREVYLAAIDQLWMEHIEKMADLREDVAFEGYNQKQPLLVYQERAYENFMNMLDALDYRVMRGLFGANSSTQVHQVEIPLDDIQAPTSANSHPLLRQKGDGDSGIKVIRIK